MAIEKEKLQAFFRDHYFSRQEVLFKLLLSVPIDAFWLELTNGRKARANFLPLYNAVGVPYWYVQTDKMVTASERLCEEALIHGDVFDPYRSPMTSAMTEEMFFTSFVEGARITFEEAMDFLEHGGEPQNVQEQMIWNNRQAWSAMASVLYRPLDEMFIKSLALLLTNDMDGVAEDYRQTDDHPILAMGGESYHVPSAAALPERMRAYYSYLQQPDVHPLIKAGIGQAFILVTRPFPEGNERLSRMISSAVLLRGGYEFFRDISISSVIARESYLYYKAMREILQPENGGDLTYFMEYYLELLVRALQAQKDREKSRKLKMENQAMETIAAEQKLAFEPLTTAVAKADQDHDHNCDHDQSGVTATQKDIDKTSKPPQLQSKLEGSQPTPPLAEGASENSQQDAPTFYWLKDITKKLKNGNTDQEKRLFALLKKLLQSHTINASDWAMNTHVSISTAYHDLNWFILRNIVKKQYIKNSVQYALLSDKEKLLFDQSCPDPMPEIMKNRAVTMYEQIGGQTYFSIGDWRKVNHVGKSTAFEAITYLIDVKWIEKSPSRLKAKYRFTDQFGQNDTAVTLLDSIDSHVRRACRSQQLESERILNQLSVMLNAKTESTQRITRKEWSAALDVSMYRALHDLNQLISNGYLERKRVGKNDIFYTSTAKGNEYLHEAKSRSGIAIQPHDIEFPGEGKRITGSGNLQIDSASYTSKTDKTFENESIHHLACFIKSVNPEQLVFTSLDWRKMFSLSAKKNLAELNALIAGEYLIRKRYGKGTKVYLLTIKAFECILSIDLREAGIQIDSEQLQIAAQKEYKQYEKRVHLEMNKINENYKNVFNELTSCFIGKTFPCREIANRVHLTSRLTSEILYKFILNGMLQRDLVSNVRYVYSFTEKFIQEQLPENKTSLLEDNHCLTEGNPSQLVTEVKSVVARELVEA